MKVLFVVRGAGFSRFFESVFRDLTAAGHSVGVLLEWHSQRRPEDQSTLARLAEASDRLGFRWGLALHREDGWRKFLFASRRLIDYSRYLRPGLQGSRMVLKRYQDYLPLIARRLVNYRAARALLTTSAAQGALRMVERLVPPDRKIAGWLRERRPDVVVASPVLMPASDEVEYVKAADALGIPTVIAVMSWDHLTTKGAFHVLPDLVMVWNGIQVNEATRLHGLPKRRVLFTGAPVFDEWFSIRPALGRDTFCRDAGLDPGKPYFLYLCSTWSIAQDETGFVERVADGLRQHSESRTASLLVRPHPSNTRIWQGHAGNSTYTIWPREAAIPGAAHIRQDFYHSLYYSAGVIGINTSGFIEAAIVDRPCVTILSERYRDTQEEISHFQHLLHAGFLEIASEEAQAAAILARILRGEDVKRENRRRFVSEFVRPWGVERSASGITAQAIEGVARRHSLDEIRSRLAAGGEGLSLHAPSPSRMAEATPVA